MNKQELIKRIEDLPYTEGSIADTITINRNWILESIEQLDEPQNFTIPQFVADWIEKYKREIDIRDAMSKAYVSIEVDDWLMEVDADGAFVNQETFARAWLDGYEIEEEKRYLVKVKGVSGYGRYLNKALSSNEYFFASNNEIKSYRTKFTRKELEEAGFGWVFDCPGIKIEEVE